MHEMGIAEQICKIVSKTMDENPGTLKKVSISVGDLSGVNADSLRFAMENIIPDTPFLSGSEVLIEELPGIISCRACGFHGEALPGMPLCSKCCSPDIAIESGMETLVETIDIEPEQTLDPEQT